MSSSWPAGRIVGKLGGNQKLECPVEDEDTSFFEWKKDGDVIHEGWDRYRVRVSF